MFDKIIYKLRNPKFCRNCGGKLITYEVFSYSEKTGEPVRRFVGVRCEHVYTCFEKYGYLYQWDERVK